MQLILVVKSQENHCFYRFKCWQAAICLLSFVDGLVHFTEINYCGLRIDRYSLPELTSMMPQFIYLFERNDIEETYSCKLIY